MPPLEREVLHLWDMLDAARGVVSSLESITVQEFMANENLRLAVERRIEIIGEAAKRVSEAFKESHPEIPWRDIIDQRNILIHMYDRIDPVRIWRLVETDIPDLIAKIEPLIPPLSPDNPE